MRKLLVLIVAVALAAVPLAAKPPEEAVLAELAGGIVGACVGLLIGLHIVRYIELATAENWSRFLTVVGDLSTIGFIALGASTGVTLTGTALGVNGNILGCFLGGAGGVLAGIFASFPLIALTGVDLDIVVVPAVTAVFATWGFNLGATSR